MSSRATQLDVRCPQPEPCACLQQESRVRVVRGGARHIVFQCLTCGAQTRPVRRDEEGDRADAELNAMFDEALSQSWQERQNAAWESFRACRNETYQQVKVESDSEWWNRYSAYLQTAEWDAKRRRRLAMDSHLCQAILSGCTGRAEQVHHLTYKHLGNEPLFDLISVCVSCHDRITTMDRERRSA
jgi:hypothetical protein